MAKRDSPARDRVSLHYRDRETQQTRELPLKILVLGDFLGHPDPRPLDEREPIQVDDRNLDAVLAEHGVWARLAGLAELGPVELRVASYADFEPERVAMLVPELRARIEARAQLTALKAWLSAEPSMAAQVQAWLVSAALADGSARELDRALLTQLEIDPDDPAIASLRAGLARYLRARLGELPPEVPAEPAIVDLASVDLDIAALDLELAAGLDAILHHPEFQALEARWRALRYLVAHVDFGENCEVHLLDVSKQELIDDFEDAPEIARSGLYRRVYAAEYGTFGGQPYGLIVSDYGFDHGPVDMALLGNCAAVAAMAHVPFVANASPRLFGEDSFERLAVYADVRAMFTAPQYQRWRSFRAQEDARYVGLCLPRVLLRGPYQAEQVLGFPYAERTPSKSAYLWGPAAFAFATRVAASFARYRWSPNIVGPTAGGAIEGLVQIPAPSLLRRHADPHAHGSAPGPALAQRMPVELQLSERHEFELAEEGFIALVFLKGSGQACLFSANSCQQPRSFAATGEGRAQALGARLGAQLPYVFIVCRVAHYLKVLQREEIGRHLERGELERELNDWLRQYVADMDNPAPAIRGQRPLRQAEVAVEEVPGQAGWYRAHLRLRPHLKYMGASFTLSLVGKLEREGA
jgi:type VI secretion system ImpC/EvpB family protein/type VI secretion system ImpB/VipA family protein